jgi:hypothetical protein
VPQEPWRSEQASIQIWRDSGSLDQDKEKRGFHNGSRLIMAAWTTFSTLFLF